MNDKNSILEKYKGKDDNMVPLYVVAIRWAVENNIEVPPIFSSETENYFSAEFSELYTKYIDLNFLVD